MLSLSGLVRESIIDHVLCALGRYRRELLLVAPSDTPPLGEAFSARALQTRFVGSVLCFDCCFFHHYKRLQHQDPDRDVRLFHEPGGLREDAVRVEPIGKSAIGAALAHILSNL